MTRFPEFIRTDNIDGADRMIAEILAAITALVPFPAQVHRRPDLTSRPLRFTLVREYHLRNLAGLFPGRLIKPQLLLGRTSEP